MATHGHTQESRMPLHLVCLCQTVPEVGQTGGAFCLSTGEGGLECMDCMVN